MGKALYREYRPKRLDEVVGQEHITTTLKNALKKGQLSHAYLFTGPRGVGKTSIARILAHEVNELEYSDESIHLDIIEIDAASNRRIDEIRDLREKVHIAPTSAKYKVYIIDEVHMLTREAFNALLKTLEEPPEHVIFILATTEIHKVPDTIISRTQRFTFKPIDEKAVVDHLKTIAKQEGLSVDEGALKLLASHGRGSFRDSISMLDQLRGLAKDKVAETDVQMLLGLPNEQLIDSIIESHRLGTIPEIFASVQGAIEQGVDSGRVALAISEKLRNMLINETMNNERKHAVIALLKALLPMTQTTNSFLELELALIETATAQENTKTERPMLEKATESVVVKQAEKLSEPKIEPKVAVEKQEENKSAEKPVLRVKEIVDSTEESTTPTADFNNDTWLTLLGDLKKKYNTLYGVLRMANPKMDSDGNFSLEFTFDFHKKQVDNPANAAVVRSYLEKHFGLKTFETTVKKTSQKKEESSTNHPQKTASVDIVTSVSNIFGGAELLE